MDPINTATTPQHEQTRAFRYEARRADGRSVTGSIDATDHTHAMSQLAALHLDVLDIRDLDRPSRGRAMTAADLQIFNQHLAYLTDAGLPVEAGLRMIAREASSKRVGETIQQIADDMERGKTLSQAVDTHRGKFPALYSQLIDAGLKSANLPGMLLNLGRHLTLVSYLRSTLWRVLAYPLFLVVILLSLVIMLSMYVLPEFDNIFEDFGTELPSLTRLVLGFGHVAPYVAVPLAILMLIAPMVLGAMRLRGYGPLLVDTLVLPLPMVGPIMRRSLTARWCDAVNIGVEAGIDLPRAIRLAGDAIASPTLIEDGGELIDALENGRPATSVVRLRIVPDVVTHAIEISRHGQGLSNSLRALTAMFTEQADIRIQVLAMYLPVFALMCIGLVLIPLVLGLFLPLLRITTSLT